MAHAAIVAAMSSRHVEKSPWTRSGIASSLLARRHRAVEDTARGVLAFPVPEAVASAESRVVLEVIGLSKWFGKHRVLEDVSFRLRTSEVLAVVGESGSGKTTLGRCLMGLSGGYSGDVRYRGDTLPSDVRRRTTNSRRLIQYIYQNPHASMNPRRSVAANVGMPFQHFFGLSARDAYDHAVELLRSVSVSASIADALPSDISGGECQRASIARALACDPDVLICDEITSALDVSVQASIVALLERLRRDRGLSLIFITHNLALVGSLADTVAVLQRGRLVEVGPTATILRTPADPYTMQLLKHTPSLLKQATTSTTYVGELARLR